MSPANTWLLAQQSLEASVGIGLIFSSGHFRTKPLGLNRCTAHQIGTNRNLTACFRTPKKAGLSHGR